MKSIILFFILLVSCQQKIKEIECELLPHSNSVCIIKSSIDKLIQTITENEKVNKTLLAGAFDPNRNIILETDIKFSREELPINDTVNYKLKRVSEYSKDYLIKINSLSCTEGKFQLSFAQKSNFLITGKFEFINNDWKVKVISSIVE